MSSWSPPQYDSDAEGMHPVLRTYAEPDVVQEESESAEIRADTPDPVTRAPRRKLRRLDSQQAVSRYATDMDGIDSDSNTEHHVEEAAHNVSHDSNVNINTAASSHSDSPCGSMSSQEAVSRFITEPNGDDDSE